jgi:hypothetical protein
VEWKKEFVPTHKLSLIPDSGISLYWDIWKYRERYDGKRIGLKGYLVGVNYTLYQDKEAYIYGVGARRNRVHLDGKFVAENKNLISKCLDNNIFVLGVIHFESGGVTLSDIEFMDNREILPPENSACFPVRE